MIGDETLILTPTARLARAEIRRLAGARHERGENAWRRPAVMAFSTWIERLADDWLVTGEAVRVPLSADQALVLWQEVIDREIFIGEPRVAELAAAAWRLIHEYRLEPPAAWQALWLSEDSRRFRDWAARFEALCAERGVIEAWALAARLPGLIESGQLELPAAIELTGFERAPTPLQQAVIDACERAGTAVNHHPPAGEPARLARIHAFTEADDELTAAARWARARLEDDPDQAIAVVVPDLDRRLTDAERAFMQVFDPPGFALADAGTPPWHVSLGPPLAEWPLVADALLLLALDPGRISQPETFRLLRSPFLAGFDQESPERSAALASIRARKPHWLHAGQLAFEAGRAGADILHARLEEWQALMREQPGRALPSEWAGRFQETLEAIGFARGRTLDSREYQTLEHWHRLLESFAALDAVITAKLPRGAALARLRERAGAQAFRERNPGCPVEILGVEEALGSRFDALWITTLDHDTWPKPARRDPLIPGPVQQGVPGATVEGCLERARQELDGLRRCAGEIRASFSRGSGEAPRLSAPLLADLEVIESEAEHRRAGIALDSVPEDTAAPGLTDGAIAGGTGVLQAQSDCPFRAFARYRLAAEDLTPRQPGLDARDRGSLVHRALEHFWQDLDGLADLQALDEAALQARIDQSCQAALEAFTRHSPLALGRAGLELEGRCLKRSLTRWLAIERQRRPFTVRALEHDIELGFGGLTLTGKIDRIDELEGGGSVVIDYKTGDSKKTGWAAQARMRDVQLPAYALSLPERPAAIAFARLRPESMGFDGLAEVDTGTPGMAVIGEIGGNSKFSEVESWPSLTGEWRQILDQLAADFIAGRAEVHPRDNDVCRYCHLHGLCRIKARRAIAGDGDD